MKKIFVLFTLIIYLLLSAEKSCVLKGQPGGCPTPAQARQIENELIILGQRTGGSDEKFCPEALPYLRKLARQFPACSITKFPQSVAYCEKLVNNQKNQYSQPFTNQPSSLQNQTELELQLQNSDRQNIERNQRFVEDSKNEIDNIEVPKSKISMENDNTEKIVPGVVVPGYGLPMITFNNIEKQELQNFKNELGDIDDVEEYEKWEAEENEESKGSSANNNLDDLEKQHLEWHKKTLEYLDAKEMEWQNKSIQKQYHQVVDDQNVSADNFNVDQATDRFSKVNLNDETSEDVEFGIGPISVENKPKQTAIDKLQNYLGKKWTNSFEVNPGKYQDTEEEKHLKDHAENTMNPFINPKLLFIGVNVGDSGKNTMKSLEGTLKNIDKALVPDDKDTFFERNF